MANLKKDEWTVESTGGGCTALAYKWDDPEMYALITAIDSAAAPNDPDAPCWFGVYKSEDNEPLIEVREFSNLAAAKQMGETACADLRDVLLPKKEFFDEKFFAVERLRHIATECHTCQRITKQLLEEPVADDGAWLKCIECNCMRRPGVSDFTDLFLEK